MYRTKTFAVNSKTKSNVRDLSHEPPNCHYMSYIAVPALIGFMLLLILVNVDFTGTAHLTALPAAPTSMPYTTATTMSYTTPAALQEEADRPEAKAEPLTSDSAKDPWARIDGFCLNNDCRVTCMTGTMYALGQALAKEQAHCNRDMDIIIRNGRFPNDRIDAELLVGNYSARSLIVQQMQLAKIEPHSFSTGSFERLEQLELLDTKISELNPQTFLGLKAITTLKIETSPSNRNMGSLNFLNPISQTLQSFEMLVVNVSKRQDPTNWLQGAELPNLKVLNFHGNFFGDTLTKRTFENLSALRELILSNCKLTSIGVGTFDPIKATLLYLDLRGNQLKSLDWSFLPAQAPVSSMLRLELNDNLWDCTVINCGVIIVLRKDWVNRADEPLCSTPADSIDEELRQAQVDCVGSGPAVRPTGSPSANTTLTTTVMPETGTKTTVASPTAAMTSTPADESTDSTSTIAYDKPTDPITAPTRTTTTVSEPVPSNNRINCLRENGHMLHVVKPPTVHFTTYTAGPTDILVKTAYHVTNLHLIYFLERSHHFKTETVTSVVLPIGNLENVQKSYILCLVPHLDEKISPFNCRSHYLDVVPRAWLDRDDKPFVFILIIVFSLVLIFATMLLTYAVLRCRPTWLWGTRRLIPVERKSNRVFLLPAQCQSKKTINTYIDLSSLRHSPNLMDMDYMEFYKNLTHKMGLQQSSDYRPPDERAPIAPRVHSQPGSNITETTFTIEEASSINEYESLDYYQPVYQ